MHAVEHLSGAPCSNGVASLGEQWQLCAAVLHTLTAGGVGYHVVLLTAPVAFREQAAGMADGKLHANASRAGSGRRRACGQPIMQPTVSGQQVP